MAEIINLKRARKRLQRQGEADAAAQNRARHGRTPAQRDADAMETAQRDSLLDGVRQEGAADADQAGPTPPNGPAASPR